MKGLFKAKFIGKNSLGYVHGKTYLLYAHPITIFELIRGWQVIISRADGSGGYCPYSSLVAFLNNWECAYVPHKPKARIVRKPILDFSNGGGW